MTFKLKRRILNITAVIFAIALVIFFNFFTKTETGISILALFLIAYLILTLVWFRCPHCNTYLWKLTPFAEYCPHCGNKLE